MDRASMHTYEPGFGSIYFLAHVKIEEAIGLLGVMTAVRVYNTLEGRVYTAFSHVNQVCYLEISDLVM
jgi:hypothetical protein